MADRTVLVNLKANVSQFKSAMGDASASMGKFQKAQQESFTQSEKWKAVGTASTVAGAALAAGLLATTKAASDQEQAMGALEAVFKSNSAAMRENAAEAVNIGLSQTQYANSAAKLGAQLSNLGLDQDQLAGTTDGLITKAADMAAQFGGPTSDAVDAISAALRKERDPIERYGIALTDATIKAEMAATGLDEMGATLSLIEKQMGNSNTLGAAAREFDTTAAATARMKANFANASASLGEALLPAMTAAANAASTVLSAFNGLSSETQTATTYGLAFAAALLLIGPRAVEAANGVIQLRAAMVASESAAVTGLAGFASLASGVLAIAGAMKVAEEATGQLRDSLTEATGTGGTAAAGAFDALRQGLLSVLDPGFALSTQMKDLASGEFAVQQSSEQAAAGLSAVGTAAGATAGNFNMTAIAADNQSDAVRALINDLETLLGINLAMSGSSDALIGQTQRLTSAVEANGRAVAGNSKGAVANREAIRQEASLIGALAKAKHDQVLAATKDEGAATAASSRLTASRIADLRANAVAAGMSAKEVDKFIRSLVEIPGTKRSAIKLDANKAKKDADDTKRKVEDIPRSHSTNVDAPGARKTQGDLDDVTDAAEDIPNSESVTVTANTGSAIGQLAGVTTQAGTIPNYIPVQVHVSQTGASIGGLIGQLAAIPQRWGGVQRFAGGGIFNGVVSGPGTGTSDSIGPVMLSDGEYVIRASSVRKYGVGALDRINRGEAPEGFAKGGSVAFAKWARRQIGKTDAWATLEWLDYNMPRSSRGAAGLGPVQWGKKKPTQGKNEEDSAFKSRVRQWRQERKQAKQDFREQIARERMDAKWSAIKAKASADEEAQRQAAETAAELQRQAADDAAQAVADLQQAKAELWKSITDSLRDASNFVSGFQSRFGSHAADVDRLAAAEDALAAARIAVNTASPAERANAEKALAEALREQADAADAARRSTASPDGVLSMFRDRAAAAEKYATDIKTLQARGLSSTILSQLATMSPDDAAQMLASLTGMTAAQIQELNSTQGRIDTAAIGLGDAVSSAIFDPAIAAARGNANYTVAVEVAPQAITLTLDGKTIAQAVATYDRRTGR